MVWIYNFIILILLILALPFILLKSLTDRRLRFKLKERFFPKPIEDSDYILLHGSSFGELKTLISVSDTIKQEFKKPLIFSAFTDTGFKAAEDKKTIIMPIDLLLLYRKLFKHTPSLAIFFETEIWPSYIAYLKKSGTKLVLLNARMSSSTFKHYKRFCFLFKPIIQRFDLIVAKSITDAKRYRYFSDRVIVCGNIKRFKKPIEFDKSTLLKTFKIHSEKPILTLASFHVEEIDLAISIVERFKNEYFIVLAPRHINLAHQFIDRLKKNKIEFSLRTSNNSAENLLLLDTLGELEKIYAISKVTIIGGSFYPSLKGHNPIEPAIYKNTVICGPYMESFFEDVDYLKQLNLICQAKEPFLEQIENCIKIQQTNDESYLKFIDGLQYILNCHLFNTKKASNQN